MVTVLTLMISVDPFQAHDSLKFIRLVLLHIHMKQNHVRVYTNEIPGSCVSTFLWPPYVRVCFAVFCVCVCVCV